MRDRNRLESELLELRAVADALEQSPRRLAAGDVHQQMDIPFPRPFDGMRKDFNRGLASVGTTIDDILGRARELRSESAELRERLKSAAEEEKHHAAVLGGMTASMAGAEDTARNQAAHADHVASIVQNARLDLDRPQRDTGEISKNLHQTCQSLAQLKSLVDDAKVMLRNASLIALNGGVNAAHSGAPGEEALGIAKTLHTLTQEIGSTIDAIGDATDQAIETSGAAGTSADRLDREFEALKLYLDAAASQLDTLGETSRHQETSLRAMRGDLTALTRKARPSEDDAELPPALHLDTMDRAAAEIERLADRFNETPTLPPPITPSPSGLRAHLRLVKS